MKRIFILLMTLFAFTAYGADIKISNLPEATTLADTDVFPVVAGTTTSKVQVTNLKTILATHNAITLSSDLGANLLGLSTQQLTLDTQTANYVFAGPTTGSAAAPTFRALVAADIPSLVATYQPLNATLTALAAQTETAGSLQYYTAAATPDVLAKGTAYQLLMMNSGATAPTWTSVLGATGTRLTTGYFTDLEITNLPTINGAAITTLLQPLDGELTALAGLTSAANAIPYFTGSGTAGVISSSANMVSLLESEDYATARGNLGVAIGTDVQAYNADLTTLSSGGTAGCLWGEKSDSSGIECKTKLNLQLDDTAAQFNSATASKGTLKFVQSSIDNGILVTVTPVATGNTTITTESYGAGTYTLVDKTSAQTLTNKTLTAPAITPAEVDGHTTSTDLTAAQVSNTIIHNYDQAASDVFLILPTAAAGYSFLLTVATAQSNHFGVEAGENDKIYLIAAAGTIAAGDDGAAVVFVEAQVGQQAACWTFKTGASSYDWACKAIAVGTSTFEAHASTE
jgi:hypothetical protein